MFVFWTIFIGFQRAHKKPKVPMLNGLHMVASHIPSYPILLETSGLQCRTLGWVMVCMARKRTKSLRSMERTSAGFVLGSSEAVLLGNYCQFTKGQGVLGEGSCPMLLIAYYMRYVGIYWLLSIGAIVRSLGQWSYPIGVGLRSESPPKSMSDDNDDLRFSRYHPGLSRMNSSTVS